jgi:pimeloyl-ACP methyl ester carboxylesterase
VSAPTLALFGDKDRHLPVEESVQALTKAFERKPNLLDVKVFSGAGHPLRLIKGEKELLARGHTGENYGERPRDYWLTIFEWLRVRGIL